MDVSRHARAQNMEPRGSGRQGVGCGLSGDKTHTPAEPPGSGARTRTGAGAEAELCAAQSPGDAVWRQCLRVALFGGQCRRSAVWLPLQTPALGFEDPQALSSLCFALRVI